MYDGELMQVILEVFGGIAEDNDSCVRNVVCQFIIGICSDCESDYHTDLLQILGTVCILN